MPEMTRNDVLALEGDALDAAVSRFVFGNTKVTRVSTDQLLQHLADRDNVRDYGNDVFLEWWDDGEWFVSKWPLVGSNRGCGYDWNAAGPDPHTAVARACIIEALGLYA